MPVDKGGNMAEERPSQYRVEVYYETKETKEKTLALKYASPKFMNTLVERADILIDWVGPVLPGDIRTIAENALEYIQSMYHKQVVKVHDVKIYPHIPDLSKLFIDLKEKGNGHDKKKEDTLKEEED